GWPEHAPFDVIVVTAAPERIPQPLLEQLAPGGRLVIPVGPVSATQQLRLVVKDAQGRLHERSVIPVRFVPLTGEAADRDRGGRQGRGGRGSDGRGGGGCGLPPPPAGEGRDGGGGPRRWVRPARATRTGRVSSR